MDINQDYIYLPSKFILDTVGLTDAQVVSQLTTDLAGNTYINGIIGMLMKYRNPSFDDTPYQNDMIILKDVCIEFLLLRYRKLFDFVSILKFFTKFVSLQNLKYAHTVIAYLIKENVIYKTQNDCELVLTTNNSYLSLSVMSISHQNVLLNSNLIPSIQALVYTSDSSVVFVSVTINNVSLTGMTTVVLSQGAFLLYPLQKYTLPQAESLIMIDSPCQIDLESYSADMSVFLYTTSILAAFQ